MLISETYYDRANRSRTGGSPRIPTMRAIVRSHGAELRGRLPSALIPTASAITVASSRTCCLGHPRCVFLCRTAIRSAGRPTDLARRPRVASSAFAQKWTIPQPDFQSNCHGTTASCTDAIDDVWPYIIVIVCFFRSSPSSLHKAVPCRFWKISLDWQLQRIYLGEYLQSRLRSDGPRNRPAVLDQFAKRRHVSPEGREGMIRRDPTSRE